MEENLSQINSQFLELLIWILVPLLLSIFLLGLASSVAQSLFNVNDVVIGFVLKFSLVLVLILVFGPQVVKKVKGFSEGVFVHLQEVLR